jgi:hypothetical protein
MRLSNRAILLLILGVSALLRFYRFPEIPFMHDEFSAVFRTEFDSFGELIKKGVMPDGHPAGIQVFLFYWIKLFGRTEWVVKLPFAVMGVLSLLLAYLVAKKWYNETVGLITASFLAGTQYMIMYSQIARPYISGLFFSLLMVYFWSKLMNPSIKKFWINGVLYVLASALCAYNHHFSLLFAALIGISGLFFIPRKFLLNYLLCGLLIFVLYIPHLGIFLNQLNTGGVGGWLGKPGITFFPDYLYYTFNYSAIAVFLAVALILFGLIRSKKGNFTIKAFVLFAVWFLTPLFIGYWYSVNINPVLQYSVLIFSYFPLLFLLFGHIPVQSIKVNLLITGIILAVNIYGLTVERQHYRIFYNSAFERIITDYIHAKNNYSNVLPVIDSHKKITSYYIEEYNTDSSFTWFDSFRNEADFINYLREESKTNDFLYFGALSSNKPNSISVIRQYFPVMLKQNNYFGGSTYLFSKTGEEARTIITTYDFDSPVPDGWRSVKEENRIDSVGFNSSFSYKMDSLTEWSPTFSIPLKQIVTHENNYIDVTVSAKPADQLPGALLVITLDLEGEVVNFSGADFGSFTNPSTSSNEWITVNHSLKLADVHLNFDNVILNVFVWNNGRKQFLLDNFSVEVRDGNPVVYGLYEDLP